MSKSKQIIKVLSFTIIVTFIFSVCFGIWLYKYEKEQRKVIRIYESEILRKKTT